MAEDKLIGTLDDFREGRGTVVEVAGRRIAVFNVAGRLLAIQDSCPHQGASLADGRVAGGRVTCHRHDWTFDLETGRETTRGRACARTYRLRIEQSRVYLEPPPETEPTTGPRDDWVLWNDDDHLK